MLRMVGNEHTARAYGRWWGRYQEEVGEAITAWGVQTWLGQLAEEGLGAASIGQARAALTKVAKGQRLRGIITRDEFLGLALEVETPKGAISGGRERRWLTLEELQAVVGALQEGRTEAARARNRVVALMLGTLGLRVGEVCAARWGDLDLERGKLRVRGKGGSYEMVDVPVILGEALAEWWERILPEGGSCIIRRVWKSGRIDGKGMGPSSIRRMVGVAGQESGVGAVSPHDIRATVAGLLADAGVEVEQIRGLLRHKNAEVTRRYIGKRGAGAGLVMAGMLELPREQGARDTRQETRDKRQELVVGSALPYPEQPLLI